MIDKITPLEIAINKRLDRWLKTLDDKNSIFHFFRAEYRIYLRKRPRKIAGKEFTVLDIANISLPENRHRKGLFTAFIDLMSKVELFELLYIESITNHSWGEHLLNNGWILDPRDVRSLIKFTNPKKKFILTSSSLIQIII